MPPFLNNKTCFPSSAALHTIAHSFNAATKFEFDSDPSLNGENVSLVDSIFDGDGVKDWAGIEVLDSDVAGDSDSQDRAFECDFSKDEVSLNGREV